VGSSGDRARAPGVFERASHTGPLLLRAAIQKGRRPKFSLLLLGRLAMTSSTPGCCFVPRRVSRVSGQTTLVSVEAVSNPLPGRHHAGHAGAVPHHRTSSRSISRIRFDDRTGPIRFAQQRFRDVARSCRPTSLRFAQLRTQFHSVRGVRCTVYDVYVGRRGRQREQQAQARALAPRDRDGARPSQRRDLERLPGRSRRYAGERPTRKARRARGRRPSSSCRLGGRRDSSSGR
jgi:hypothetical protein